MISSFVRPFFITFFVTVFVLLMQFVWKYIDDLVGRGVEWYYIVEVMLYSSATLVPLALPLAILLSSIMTFGTMGEHYELAAMKSSGISLYRIMRPLIILMLFISIGAFMFSNYVIPVSNLKSQNLLRNIAAQKPALNIREGIFYTGIEGFSIKVGKKYGKDKKKLQDIIIYDHSNRKGNTKVILANKGSMDLSEDERFLIITLIDGHSYEELEPGSRKDRHKKPFVKTAFSRDVIRFNLEQFQAGDLKKITKKDYKMLNIGQLTRSADSLSVDFDEKKMLFATQLRQKYQFDKVEFNDTNQVALDNDILANIKGASMRNRVIQNALRLARSSKYYVTSTERSFWYRKRLIAKHYLEIHRKFSLSFACIVLFFIGAPLGAIIRKGGMGMPVVVAVIIFLIFYTLSIIGEKMGREHLLQPFEAMWIAPLVLMPVGIFLTYKAATDSVLFNIELYLKPFEKLVAIFRKKPQKTT